MTCPNCHATEGITTAPVATGSQSYKQHICGNCGHGWSSDHVVIEDVPVEPVVEEVQQPIVDAVDEALLPETPEEL